jgi:hypothetical protein
LDSLPKGFAVTIACGTDHVLVNLSGFTIIAVIQAGLAGRAGRAETSLNTGPRSVTGQVAITPAVGNLCSTDLEFIIIESI